MSISRISRGQTAKYDGVSCVNCGNKKFKKDSEYSVIVCGEYHHFDVCKCAKCGKRMEIFARATKSKRRPSAIVSGSIDCWKYIGPITPEQSCESCFQCDCEKIPEAEATIPSIRLLKRWK